MQLISLNTWGGNLKNALEQFVIKQSADTDIFCFQEVFDNATHPRIKNLGNIDKDLFSHLKRMLPNYLAFYAPSQIDDEGLAIFVKPNVEILSDGSVFVHKQLNSLRNDDGRTLGRNIQYLKLRKKDRLYTVINFHGLWTGSGKEDTSERIQQSQKINTFINDQSEGNVVLVGDFNLNPDTESMAILNRGRRNLIKEYGITSTRSSAHTWSNKYADYAIVSDDINVQKFEVLKDEVSDHLPLLLDFN